MTSFTFWLGTHRPGWLAKLDVPLMVSHRGHDIVAPPWENPHVPTGAEWPK